MRRGKSEKKDVAAQDASKTSKKDTSMKITLCIPLYNEEKILPGTVKQAKEFMARYGDEGELIFIDDGSTDGSLAILREAEDVRTRVITYTPNRGKGYAVRQGMLMGEGDFIIFTDCDLAYGLEKAAEMADAFFAHPEWDGVIGSRHLGKSGDEGYTFLRKLASRAYLGILKTYGGLKHSDSQCGIKGFSRRVAREIFSLCEMDRFSFDFEAILIARRLGFEIGEYPVTIVNHRESKVNIWRDSTGMLKDLRRIKRRLKKGNIGKNP